MDRITTTSPSLAINAYAKVAPAPRVAGAPGVTKAQPVEPIARIGTPTQSTPRPAADPSRLVAGSVEPINLAVDVTPLAGARPVMTSAGTYSIHPSAGDRNAAATGVNVGRSLDLRG